MTTKQAIRAIVQLAQRRGWGGEVELATSIATGLAAVDRSEVDERLVKSLIPESFSARNGESRASIAKLVLDVLPTARDSTSRSQAVDCVVVTALPVEAEQVIKLLGNVREVTSVVGTVYSIGELIGQKSRITVAVVQSQAGNSNAALETERALAMFSPEVSMFIGIAGGLKDDVSKGDVVVGNHIYEYSGGKDTAEGLQPRIRELQPSYKLIQRTLAESIRNDWLPLDAPAAAPRVLVKPIAAGPRVVASLESATAVWIKKFCGDALAVEMEGFGFLQAAFAYKGTEAIVIRGISDLVDDKSDPDNDAVWQVLAAQRAALFGLHILGRYLGDLRRKESQ